MLDVFARCARTTASAGLRRRERPGALQLRPRRRRAARAGRRSRSSTRDGEAARAELRRGRTRRRSGRTAWPRRGRAGRPRARPRRQDARVAPDHARRCSGSARSRSRARRCCARKDLAFRIEHSGARLVVADRPAPRRRWRARRGRAVHGRGRPGRSRPPRPRGHGRPSDTAFILYTSGTTKDPKGVVAHARVHASRSACRPSAGSPRGPGDLVWCTAGDRLGEVDLERAARPWSAGAVDRAARGRRSIPRERFDLLGELGVTVLCQAPTEYRLRRSSTTLEPLRPSGSATWSRPASRSTPR